MQLHPGSLLLVVLALQCCTFSGGEHLSAQARDLGNEYPSSVSLCGENLAKETGTLNGLYYVYYESTATKADVPMILWLSGGPGCSGLVALLFENGPCSFDDETDKVSFNPYSWTGLAHVIYLDQPKGTGFSDGDNGIMQPWTLGGATDDMHGFLRDFYLLHPQLRVRDFYIFGESYAGHYVPDLAVRMLDSNASFPTLKGIAIGNGVVSTKAWIASAMPFLKYNSYGYDFLGSNEQLLQTYRDRFMSALANCNRRNHLRHSSSEGVSNECDDAFQSLTDFSGMVSSTVEGLGRNVYDIRRECHCDDPIRLCYRFSRLQTFVNSPGASAYFGETPHKWQLCASGALPELAVTDKLEESEANVARALEHGVRVLVYGGDADTVANWMTQDAWTRDLSWKHQAEFTCASFAEQIFQGQPIGRVRTSHGFSFMKIYNAGHMVPHDQPANSYEIARSFIYDVPGVGLFS